VAGRRSATGAASPPGGAVRRGSRPRPAAIDCPPRQARPPGRPPARPAGRESVIAI